MEKFILKQAKKNPLFHILGIKDRLTSVCQMCTEYFLSPGYL
jgi:hypothetical protein